MTISFESQTHIFCETLLENAIYKPLSVKVTMKWEVLAAQWKTWGWQRNKTTASFKQTSVSAEKLLLTVRLGRSVWTFSPIIPKPTSWSLGLLSTPTSQPRDTEKPFRSVQLLKPHFWHVLQKGQPSNRGVHNLNRVHSLQTTGLLQQDWSTPDSIWSTKFQISISHLHTPQPQRNTVIQGC